jgi:hypothetical protein
VESLSAKIVTLQSNNKTSPINRIYTTAPAASSDNMYGDVLEKQVKKWCESLEIAQCNMVENLKPKSVSRKRRS